MKKISILAITACFLWQTLVLGSALLLETTPYGTVDWIKQTITCTGVGSAPEAGKKALNRRVALAYSYLNLHTTLENIKYDSTKKVEDLLINDPFIKTEIKNLIRTTPLENEKDLDNKYEISLRINLDDLRQLVGSPTPEGHSSVSSQTEDQRYTSLIIDASTLKLEPCLYPKISDEGGSILYNQATYYAPSLEEAKNHKTAGLFPLIITAQKSDGEKYKTDIILTREDSERIQRAEDGAHFLKDKKVLIIL